MGVGGTQINLLPPEARLSLESAHCLFLYIAGNNECIGSDHDAYTTVNAKGNCFDENIVMNSRCRFSVPAAVSRKRKGAEVALCRRVLRIDRGTQPGQPITCFELTPYNLIGLFLGSEAGSSVSIIAFSKVRARIYFIDAHNESTESQRQQSQ